MIGKENNSNGITTAKHDIWNVSARGRTSEDILDIVTWFDAMSSVPTCIQDVSVDNAM